MTHSMVTICVWSVLAAVTYAEGPFNSPVRIGELTGDWLLEAQPGEYKQLLRLSTGGHGTWSQNAHAHPFGFAWFIEEDQLVLFHYTDQGNFNFRVKERRFHYELTVDPAAQPPRQLAKHGARRGRATAKTVLTLKDGDKTLVFKRTLLQPKFDPNLGGIQLQLSNYDAIATTALILDSDGDRVLLIPHFTNIDTKEGNYRRGAYCEFPPGKYVVLAATEGKPVAKATVELLAGRETPVRVHFKRDESRIDVAEPREKHGHKFDNDSP